PRPSAPWPARGPGRWSTPGARGRAWGRTGSSMVLLEGFRSRRCVDRHREPLAERPDPAAEGRASHGHRLPGRASRTEVGDVVVQADRPEAILQPPELEGAIILRERERRQGLGIREDQDRSKTGPEHLLPARQAVQVIGRYPVLPG